MKPDKHVMQAMAATLEAQANLAEEMLSEAEAGSQEEKYWREMVKAVRATSDQAHIITEVYTEKS